jgi:Zn-dependent protease with chaperone function
VWFGTWEGWQMGVIPGYIKLLILLAVLGFGLLLGAFGIVADMRKLFDPEPLRVTGVMLERNEMPDLFARVARLAERLGSRKPERIVLGIEPTAFVANVHLRLRGVGDYPRAETLYLPTVALRVLEDAELDALIGHELGHFRGEDVQFSDRFAPAFRSLEIATEAVNDEGDDEDASSLALMPAIGLLAFMTYTLNRFVSRIRREREFVADQASLEVSNPRAAASLLVKFGTLTLQWEVFRAHFTRMLRGGTARRNQSRDYVARTRQFIGAVNQEALRKGLFALHIPHPLDSHPTLAQRLAAIGVDPATIVGSSLAAILSGRPVPHGLEAIEERITATDAEFYRDPGDRLTVSEDAELPAELRYGTA